MSRTSASSAVAVVNRGWIYPQLLTSNGAAAMSGLDSEPAAIMSPRCNRRSAAIGSTYRDLNRPVEGTCNLQRKEHYRGHQLCRMDPAVPSSRRPHARIDFLQTGDVARTSCCNTSTALCSTRMPSMYGCHASRRASTASSLRSISSAIVPVPFPSSGPLDCGQSLIVATVVPARLCRASRSITSAWHARRTQLWSAYSHRATFRRTAAACARQCAPLPAPGPT